MEDVLLPSSRAVPPAGAVVRYTLVLISTSRPALPPPGEVPATEKTAPPGIRNPRRRSRSAADTVSERERIPGRQAAFSPSKGKPSFFRAFPLQYRPLPPGKEDIPPFFPMRPIFLPMGEPSVGIVMAQEQPVFAPAGEHPVGFLRSLVTRSSTSTPR